MSGYLFNDDSMKSSQVPDALTSLEKQTIPKTTNSKYFDSAGDTAVQVIQISVESLNLLSLLLFTITGAKLV